MHGQIKTAYIRKFTIIYVIQVSKGFPGSGACRGAKKNINSLNVIEKKKHDKKHK